MGIWESVKCLTQCAVKNKIIIVKYCLMQFVPVVHHLKSILVVLHAAHCRKSQIRVQMIVDECVSFQNAIN